MSRLYWEVQSLKDREKIYEYLHQFNPKAAEKTDEMIEERANFLAKQPLLGVRRENIKGRLLIIPEISMIISYYVQGNDIRVMRVLHQKQRFPS